MIKDNILASIALFGVYRNDNKDTYDLVAQFITAIISQNGYTQFDAIDIQEGIKEVYQIDLPISVIKSVCKNRIAGVNLNNGVFSCARIPNDIIDNEYNKLIEEYEGLFNPLIKFVRTKTQDFSDNLIKGRFIDYLLTEGNTSEARLNSFYAAYIFNNCDDIQFRHKIDLLSSGLISYNGLSYTDTSGSNGAWTDKLTIFLDTEFLLSCAGYNGDYYQTVFKELYDLIKEVNQANRQRTKRDADLIELRYLKDTRNVYCGLLSTAKDLIERKCAPDPSKKALVKIVQESTSVFDVETHRSIIDSAIKDIYHISYDDRDYSQFVIDPSYITFDEATITTLNKEFNPENDDNTSRKIDYYSRIYTIIKGLRGNSEVNVFEKCRYIFLTGSRIGRGTSLAAQLNKKSVALGTDIDFIVSRIWFKLNKPLINNRIPVSLDIVARSQAVLSCEVARKVKSLYDDLLTKDLTNDQKKTLYSNLVEAGQFLEPYNENSIDDVLNFIEYTKIDELIDSLRKLRKKAAEVENKDTELSVANARVAEQDKKIADLQQSIIEKDKSHHQHQVEANALYIRKDRTIKFLSVVIALLIIALALFFIL